MTHFIKEQMPERSTGEWTTSLRAEAGTYVLWLCVTAPQSVTVGRLGTMAVRPGVYAYVGSAFGSGGVRARVRRHWSGTATPHWHIDYLRPAGGLDRVWHTYDAERRECSWAHALQALPKARTPLVGFGASDCCCASHLLAWAGAPSLAAFRERLLERSQAHAPIYCTGI
jgi:Uri superfamily endonuclease